MLLLLAYIGAVLAFENSDTQSIWEFVMGGNFVTSIFRGMQAFSQGQVDVETKTTGSWMTQFFVGFTTLVMVTAYTALVTTQLVSASVNRINSMEKAVDLGLTFCAADIIHEDLLSRYPKLRSQQLIEAYQGAKPELDRMDDGDCDAAIIANGYWFAARVGNDTHASEHCATKEKLPQ